MKRFTRLICLDSEFDKSIEVIEGELRRETPRPTVINGQTAEVSYAYLTEALHRLASKTTAPSLIIASSESERDKLASILEGAGIKCGIYKSRDYIFYNISASHETERERLTVLLGILGGEYDAVLTTAPAAASLTLPASVLLDLIVKLKLGLELSPQRLCRILDTTGHKRVSLVEAAGQYARRGGIVDFYSSEDSIPIRVEFFGDEIDRLSVFDVISQRSKESLEWADITPVLEVMPDESAIMRLRTEINKLKSASSDSQTTAALDGELAALDEGMPLLTRDKYLNIIYPKAETLLDYIAHMGRSVNFVIGTTEAESALRRSEELINESRELLLSRGLLGKSCGKCYLSLGEMWQSLRQGALVNINPFAGGTAGELAGLFGFRTRRTVGYGDNNNSLLIEDISGYKKNGYRIIVTSPNAAGARSIYDVLEDEGLGPLYTENIEKIKLGELKAGSLVVTVGEGEGYDLISPRVALLSCEKDEGARIMAERRARRTLRRVGGAAERIMSHNDLSEGDYIVHANYGIGRFLGIESVRALGVTKDYIAIQYAGTDKLYVPADRLEMISKYIGAGASDGTVKLSKMGGTEWHKTKARAKRAAEDIAKHLLEIYAKRQNSAGFSFPEDSELEDEFANDFEYELTDSQKMAIDEIKRDMTRPQPMNRLLLGDVGFGKTEVALRAAFKAIMGGKQVAILVPTTILAMQHFQTAISRMRGYAVNVEMLSRFRTPKEVRRILTDTARGKVDVLIGTHMLLSSRVEFKRLGLLIVDEEQRFGVTQKERLKEMSVGVDVLTLSATPIPRTLNMAINGISDMSVLDEAPGDRHPVQTFVLEHDDALIFDALRKELARGGQVLYLYNKVETIEFCAGKIMSEIPEARVAYAHGQMEREEIEDIWQLLVRGDIDILVCTTIIETGVDLPNANTLIIEDADKMGLSQLHQIRGRVGRSSRRAYAYFTYRPGKLLSEVAAKRLSAIREYAEFGAGFKVALRDLEIRGAGNILGSEQHGYIDSVGYDMYVKLLAEAVAEVRGEAPKAVFESVVDIKVDAHIPESYIASSRERMEMYKRISDIGSLEHKLDVIDEFTDRFGNMPRVTETLLSVSLSRAIMEQSHIKRAYVEGNTLRFEMDKADPARWGAIMAKYQGRLYAASGKSAIVMRLLPTDDPIASLEGLLIEYSKTAE